MARLLAFAVVAACCVAPEPTPRPGAFEDLRRTVAALDDVVGEYPLAVKDGAVVNATKLRVLDRLLHDAQVFIMRFPEDERAALRGIAEAVTAHAQPTRVVAAAQALRRQLLARRQIVLGPAEVPDRARAAQLWSMLCVGCHGTTGIGDGAQGLDLDPPPKDFHEWALMETLSPTRAFSQISDGVRGTAMPQWGLFSTSERWGLAFLVFGFRHDEEAVMRGRAVMASRGVAPSHVALADRSDGELLDQLRDRGLDPESAADAVAFLRVEAAFAPPSGTLADVRTELAEVARSYRRHRDEDALAHVHAARAGLARSIDAIRAAAPWTAARIETRLAALGGRITADVLPEVLERDLVRVGPLLDHAEDVLRAPRVGGTIRLALEWTVLPALGLGFLIALGRRRTDPARARRPWRAPLAACLGSMAVGVVLSPATAATGLATITVVVVLLATLVVPAFRGMVIVAVAAMIGLPLGVLGRALGGWFGAAGAASWAAAVATVAATTFAVYALAKHRLPGRGPITAVAVALAAGASAGRGAWILSTAVTHPPIVETWRIEALGVFPTTAALVAAAAGVSLALFAGAVRRVA